MPKLDDSILVKKFTKKSYRPWNLLDDFIEPSIPNKLEQSPNKISENSNVLENTQTSLEFDKANPGQTQDEIRTNSGQTKDKTKNKSGTNLGQTQDIEIETQDKLRAQPRTLIRTNPGQTQDNLDISSSFLSLVGLQLQITILIYEACKISRSKCTDPISIEYIANACKTSKLSIHKTIQRLEKKKILYRSHYKAGRGGWTQYGLYEAIFQEILHQETRDKLRTNSGQIQDKLGTQLRTQPRTSFSSSSSYINKSTTTNLQETEQKTSVLLCPDWESIDLLPLEKIGFTKNHLMQLVHQGKLSPEMVQDSIYAFAFDLNHNNKISDIRANPINYFMGILRNGLPYAFPENYESPQQLALRKYLESKKQVELHQSKLEDELMEKEFNDWVLTLSEEDVKEIMPSNLHKIKNNSSIRRGALREYFKKNNWPQVRSNLLKNIEN